MGSALWAGISGLNASSKSLDVIANNLANVNTLGFKSGSTFFSDVLSSSLSGGASGTLQVGRGVAVSAVQTQFGAGAFESTGNATDVAIDGDGFFMVNDLAGATFYTRAGAFHLDADGLMVDTNGYKVQGRAVEGGVPTGALGDINLTASKSQPTVSTTFSIGANLNSTTLRGGQYSTTQTLYDSLGSKRTLNTTFTRTEHSGTGYWAVNSTLDGEAATSISSDGLIFNTDGTCTEIYSGTVGTTGQKVGAITTAQHNTVGLVTDGPATGTAGTPVLTGLVSAAPITLVTPANITASTTASSPIVCTFASGTWSLNANAIYPTASFINVGGGVFGIDLGGGLVSDLTFTPTATGDGTVSFALTKAAAGTALATVNRPALVDADGTMKLTRDSSTAAGWKFNIAGDKGGYTSAQITSTAIGGPVTISLDGSGTTDLTLSLTGTWADNQTATFTLDNLTGTGKTATVTLVRPGMVYQDSTLKVTKGDTVWTVEGKGLYSNATVNSTLLTEPVTISLDGSGTTDLTLTPTTTGGAWVTGDTAVFSLTHTASSLGDITVNYTGIPLDGGATIGDATGNISWNLLGDSALNITQYSTASVIRALTADGYSSGNLKSLSISANGRINGFFTNGQTADLAQIMLAAFPNPWGLKKMGNNLFGETVLSGATVQNYPGESGMGSLTPNTLEMSNTDIATEFIKMITAQKAYQANARVVTTQDAIMQELMNLKR